MNSNLKTSFWNQAIQTILQNLEILKTLQQQIFQLLVRRQGSLDNVVEMLRTYFLISRKLDYCHSINLIKTLQFILLLIIMSIVTSNFYKYIFLGLLVVTLSFVIYIIITEFLRLKSLHVILEARTLFRISVINIWVISNFPCDLPSIIVHARDQKICASLTEICLKRTDASTEVRWSQKFIWLRSSEL